MSYSIKIYLYLIITIADPALAGPETTFGIDTPGPASLHSPCFCLTVLDAARNSDAMPAKSAFV